MGQNYRTSRIEHWKPNDSLHFHSRFRERSPAKNSFNEPYYQYRETKIEHKPAYRSSPTFNSSVFTPQTFNYNVRAQISRQHHQVNKALICTNCQLWAESE